MHSAGLEPQGTVLVLSDEKPVLEIGLLGLAKVNEAKGPDQQAIETQLASKAAGHPRCRAGMTTVEKEACDDNGVTAHNHLVARMNRLVLIAQDATAKEATGGKGGQTQYFCQDQVRR